MVTDTKPEILRDFPTTLGDNPTLMERWLHQSIEAKQQELQLEWPNNRYAMNDIRWGATSAFGFAVITQEVVDGIIAVALQHGLTTLLGVGSGSGYLERELRARTSDLDITSTDPDTKRTVDVHCDHREALQMIAGNPDAGLLLSWPEFNPEIDWPAETVKNFHGKLIFYIGEGKTWCTGTDEMHDALDDLYRPLEHDIVVPTFDQINDRLVIYERK